MIVEPARRDEFRGGGAVVVTEGGVRIGWGEDRGRSHERGRHSADPGLGHGEDVAVPEPQRAADDAGRRRRAVREACDLDVESQATKDSRLAPVEDLGNVVVRGRDQRIRGGRDRPCHDGFRGHLQEVRRLLRRSVSRDERLRYRWRQLPVGPIVRDHVARRLPGRSDRHDHGTRASARTRRATCRSAERVHRREQPARRRCRSWPSVRLASGHPVSGGIARRSRSSSSTSTTTTTTGTQAPGTTFKTRPGSISSQLGHPLALTISGVGTVASVVPGLACASSMHDPVGRRHPDGTHRSACAGRRFVGWSGACTGRGRLFHHPQQSGRRVGVFGSVRVPVALGRQEGNHHVRAALRQDVRRRCVSRFAQYPRRSWKFASWTSDCAKVRIATCRRRRTSTCALGRSSGGALRSEPKSRSSVPRGGGMPGSSPRTSPTVPVRSASTSCRWIVSSSPVARRGSRCVGKVGVAVDRRLEREPHRVFDEAWLQVRMLDDEQLVRALPAARDR